MSIIVATWSTTYYCNLVSIIIRIKSINLRFGNNYQPTRISCVTWCLKIWASSNAWGLNMMPHLSKFLIFGNWIDEPWMQITLWHCHYSVILRRWKRDHLTYVSTKGITRFLKLKIIWVLMNNCSIHLIVTTTRWQKVAIAFERGLQSDGNHPPLKWYSWAKPLITDYNANY
jgi:hypothetical protein